MIRSRQGEVMGQNATFEGAAKFALNVGRPTEPPSCESLERSSQVAR
ncbi:hypothetical protein ACCUM_1232 [Candidatus Accumulibacter phosphatis]|uniref:Uncharacterized protein n=1 Tax=Candidatus Accumulibacter phosphatis TaxID=327160 RepID=A0A5S4EJG2_9PROT|nr:hypothetical protein ACCUM_1232 [Candidatus Accumulibacter phosphatis]